MWLYAVSKPTKLKLIREVKSGDSGIYKRIEKKSRSFKASDNLKIWLTSFFGTIREVIMPMCENQNGATYRHLPSWFTIEIVLNEYIKDMENTNKGIAKLRK
jgi:hypothetical protein